MISISNVHCSTHVSVVRKLEGLKRALRVVGSFGAIDNSRLSLKLFEGVQFILDTNDGVWLDSAMKSYLKHIVSEIVTNSDDIGDVLIGMCMCFIRAKRAKSRVALTVTHASRTGKHTDENLCITVLFDLTYRNELLSS